MVKHHFLTFGKGAGFIAASKRLAEEAKQLDIFDKIHVYNDTDLQQFEPFWSTHSNFLKNNPKMYGFGIWKPFLIMQVMEQLENNDILFYADSGCEFDTECEDPKLAYQSLLQPLRKHKIIASYSGRDHKMTKMDLIVHMKLSNQYITDKQRQATAILFCKCDAVFQLVKDWYNTCCNYYLINNEPSKLANIPDFLEHRHEQSVFSLLTKKYNLYAKEETIEKCICLSRNRSGKKRLAPRVIGSNYYYPNDDANIFFDEKQVYHMSKLAHKVMPQYILETGFRSGRTAATMSQSLLYCEKPIIKYVICEKDFNNKFKSYLNFFKGMLKHFFEIVIANNNSRMLFQTDYLSKQFPEGIDWFTVDGDNEYEGMLSDLCTVFPHMNKGSIMYVVNYNRSYGTKNACDVFYNVVSKSDVEVFIEKTSENKSACYFKIPL